VAALTYHIESAADACRVVWDGPTEHTADTIVTDSRGEADGGALGEAVQFVTDMLSEREGEAAKIFAQARKLGIAESTLRRAKAKLKVRPTRRGFGADGVWVWNLPNLDGQTEPIGAHPPDTATYDGNGHLWSPTRPETLAHCGVSGCIQIVSIGERCVRHQADRRSGAIGPPADSPRP